MANHQGRARGTLDMAHMRQETLPSILARNARDLTDQPAIRSKEYGIWRVWTWRQVHSETRAIAAGLAALGVKRGAPMVIVGDNRPHLYWSICAAQALGAVPVP